MQLIALSAGRQSEIDRYVDRFSLLTASRTIKNDAHRLAGHAFAQPKHPRAWESGIGICRDRLKYFAKIYATWPSNAADEGDCEGGEVPVEVLVPHLDRHARERT